MPDYVTLSWRHIRDDATCGICKTTAEDLQHALIECPHAKLFWEAAKELLNLKLPRLHPNTWTKDIVCESSIPEEDRPKIITIMASIWDSQNKITHGEAGYNPIACMEYVQEALLGLEMNPDQQRPMPRRPICRWQRPPEGTIKINSNGALALQDGVAGGGGVARDSRGFRGA
jgi:hypothetical protein